MKYLYIILFVPPFITTIVCSMKQKPLRRIKAWTHEEYEKARKQMLKDAIMRDQTKKGIRHRKRDEKCGK